MKPEQLSDFDLGSGQEDVPCGKFITVEKQLRHAAAGGESADSDAVRPNSFTFE